MRVNCVGLHVYVRSQHASQGPMVLPVLTGVCAKLGCPVTMRRGAVDAQLGQQGLAVRDVRMRRKSNLIIQMEIFTLVKVDI